MNQHQFCRVSLASARESAKEQHVVLPRLTMTSAWGYVVVWDGKTIIWEGNACCRWYARARAVLKFIDMER